MDDPKDICCICGATGETNSFKDMNEADFELVCPDCEGKKCSDCGFLRSKMKFNEPRYFCRYRGSIENPNDEVCEWFDEQEQDHSEESTIEDYS